MSRVSWRGLAKVLVACAGALVLLLLLLCWAVYYGPDKHEVTKHARIEWNREFRKVGLDDLPMHAKYAGGAWSYGDHGHWSFRTDVAAMHRWLSRSQSLRTAEVTAKPGKKAYLFYAPTVHTACLVMVILGDGEAWARVETIDIGAGKARSNGGTQAVKNALETLAFKLSHTGVWAEE